MARTPDRTAGLHLAVIGLNHKVADVSLRERIAVVPELRERFMERIVECPHIAGGVVLSTCNRTELYLSTTEWIDRDQLQALLVQDRCSGIELDDQCFYVYRKGDVPRHLFRVSAGLDSMILGENQILAQVKQVYADALQARSTDAVLNRLLTSAIESGKHVRERTRISMGAVSVAYAAAELARQVYGEMGEVSALVIGGGKTGRMTACHLHDAGVRRWWVCSRSAERAGDLARELGGDVLPWSALQQPLEIDAHLIVSATAAPETILRPEHFKHLVGRHARRNGMPLTCVDLAMPRDIDAAVGRLPGTYLYNIDDLEDVIQDNLALRQQETHCARLITDEDVAAFEAWRRERRVSKTIAQLTSKFEAVRQREMADHLNDFSQGDREQAERFSKRLLNAVLHAAIGDLKRTAREREDDQVPESVRDIFAKLEEPSDVSEPAENR